MIELKKLRRGAWGPDLLRQHPGILTAAAL